jgi:hypothetical protein
MLVLLLIYILTVCCVDEKEKKKEMESRKDETRREINEQLKLFNVRIDSC